MAVVHMMIGIQGSGKSSYSRFLEKTRGIKIVSTDLVRQLHPDWAEPLIWPEVYHLCAVELESGRDVIFDATNITPKVRKRFVDEVSKYYQTFDMKGYFFQIPTSTCVERVAKRNNDPGELKLPLEVISSYAEKIIAPTNEEGFIEIITITEEDEMKLYKLVG